MTGLNNEKCEACRRDSPSVTAEDVARLKPEIPEWELTHENGIPKLDRVFTFENFQTAMNFTFQLGELAEDQGHHPRLITEWGRVQVTWWTHKIRNLHRNDFVMAAKSDAIFSNQRNIGQE
tara:strand:- start:70 stop:432 length:363 start_codon:yes stop_codon:yes gene_type:complete